MEITIGLKYSFEFQSTGNGSELLRSDHTVCELPIWGAHIGTI